MALKAVVGLAWVNAVLFGIAGRVDWPAAWLLSSLWAGYLLIGGWWFLRNSPDLVEERMRTAANVPGWDRVLVRVYWALLVAFFITAALDAGRFRWSRMTTAIQTAGAVVVVAAFAAIWWCGAANRFLSSHVRIQTERGHRVVQDGPYRYVRHPMYTSLIVLMFGMALLLGSWLALIPAALIAVLFAIRASLEDRTLQAGLPGYAEYASRVRGRLLPRL